MGCSDYDEYCHGCHKKWICNTGVILSIISCIAVAIAISSTTPEEFKYGGKYFDIFPPWMELIYILGVISISFTAGLLICLITGVVVYKREIKRLFKYKRLESKNKRTYKF